MAMSFFTCFTFFLTVRFYFVIGSPQVERVYIFFILLTAFRRFKKKVNLNLSLFFNVLFYFVKILF